MIKTSSLGRYGQTPPLLLAVVLSGLYGGRWPALLALVLSIPVVTLVFVAPPHPLPGFAVIGTIIAWLSGMQHETAESLRGTAIALREKLDQLEKSNAALHAEIAARKEAEDELRRSRAELAHMNRVLQLGELAASIAHEVNQPHAAVMTDAGAATRWLNATPPNPTETRKALARIQDSTARAADVIARIRTLAKKSPLQMTRVDINETITSVLALARSEIERNRILVRMELQGDLPAVEGDRVQLQQVVLNLVMNAMDAMVGSQPRDLVISTRQAGDKLRVSVSDSGCGLDVAAVERLFDPFYTTKPEGMGMGLAICRSIILSHGGELSARGNAPHGAIFEFELPSEQAPAVAA
ncbi:MAG: hypothetical protein JOY71_07700 [Acetobacteraceae bacterium]|nr:hypothetical protein [Acetobacteraceae bacterium]